MTAPRTEMNDKTRDDVARIKELNDKATQILLFLSFAMVAAVTLLPNEPFGFYYQKLALYSAMQWWTVAIFPVIVCVLPLKEMRKDNVGWYRILRWFKVVLLWVAVGCIIIGAVRFYRAI